MLYYAFEYSDRLPARVRDAPERSEFARSLVVVNVAVGGLDRPKTEMVCYLDGVAARCRHLPDAIVAASSRAEVDPPTVLGEAGHVIIRRVQSQVARSATGSRDHVDL